MISVERPEPGLQNRAHSLKLRDTMTGQATRFEHTSALTSSAITAAADWPE
jgi:hypothetical protein